MDWIETIHVRSHSPRHRDLAISAFGQLSPGVRETDMEQFALFKSLSVDGDLTLFIAWNGPVPPQGKSSLGFRLASACSDFGQINHSVWICEGKTPITEYKEKRA